MQSRRKYALLATAAGSALLGFSRYTAQAATYDWSATATSVTWTTAGNWVQGTVPANDLLTDYARFNQTSYAFQPTAGTRSLLGLIVGDAASTVTTGPLTITTTNLSLGAGGITVNANAGGTRIGKITATTEQTWTNNSAGVLTLAGANVISSTVTVAGSGAVTFSGATSLSAGIVLATSGSIVTVASDFTGLGGVTIDGSFVSSASNTPFGSNLLTIKGGGLGASAQRIYSNNINVLGDFTLFTFTSSFTLAGNVVTTGDRIITLDMNAGVTKNLAVTNAVTLGGNLELKSAATNFGSSSFVFNGGFATGGADRTITLSQSIGAGPTIGQLKLDANLTFAGAGTLATAVSGGADLGGADRSITFNNTGGPLTFSGTLVGSPTVLSLKGSSTVDIVGPLAGAHAINVDATGAIRFNSTNTWTGGTTLTAGTMIIAGDSVVAGGVVTAGPVGTGAFHIGSGTNAANLQDNATTTRRINNAVFLDGDLTFSTTAASGRIAFDGIKDTAGNLLGTPNPITLTRTNQYTVNDTVTVDMIGQITGAFGLTKLGNGTLNIGSTSTGAPDTVANTYTGLSTFSGGSSTLNKATGLNAIVGDVLIDGTATLQLNQTENIADTSNVTINPGGTLNLNGKTETIANITVTGGTITSTTGTFSVGAAGAIVVNSGAVNVQRVTTGSAGLVVGSGANVTIGSGGLTLAGNVSFNGATAGASVTGGTTLNGSRVFNVTDASDTVDDLNYIGALSDGSTTSGLTKTGAGTLVLTGTATFTGPITVTQGRVRLGNINRVGPTTPVVLNGGTFDTGGFTDGMGTVSLTEDSFIDLGIGSTSVLTFGGAGTIELDETLTVLNWSGLAAGGGTEKLVIGGTALTTAQKATIFFLNPDGFTAGLYNANQLGTGELVPTALAPEPSALCLIVFGGAGLLRRRRRGAQVG